MRRRGFTLIELALVIAIIALMASAAVLSPIHTAGKHRFETLCQELARADGVVRSAARQGGNVQRLVYDLDSHELLWQTTDNTDPAPLVRLDGVGEMELRTAESVTSSGQVQIECSPAGYSQSYAIRLQAVGHTPQWMVVSGLTGSIAWINDETQVDAIFQSLAAHAMQASGDDAH
jgi:prepilin-type N-terminal cleavage/methylation domain-containing protein